MKTNADAFFSIGKTHMVCQDYAKAGLQHGFPYALVSDGCSSSPNTDIGARLLTSTAAFNMRWITAGVCSFEEQEPYILQAAQQALWPLGLDLKSLDATLVAAYWSPEEEGIRVSMRGDGVVVARDREGHWGFWTVDHERNAPRYMSYDLDPQRLERYKQKFGDKCQSTPYSSSNGWAPAGSLPYQGHPPDWFFEAEFFDLVMVLSDGVHTFQRVVDTGTSRTLVDVPVKKVIEQLLQIKGTKGKFLQRRCHKFLNTFCPLNGWQHADDFSAAAIWMGEPE